MQSLPILRSKPTGPAGISELARNRPITPRQPKDQPDPQSRSAEIFRHSPAISRLNRQSLRGAQHFLQDVLDIENEPLQRGYLPSFFLNALKLPAEGHWHAPRHCTKVPFRWRRTAAPPPAATMSVLTSSRRYFPYRKNSRPIEQFDLLSILQPFCSCGDALG